MRTKRAAKRGGKLLLLSNTLGILQIYLIVVVCKGGVLGRVDYVDFSSLISKVLKGISQTNSRELLVVLGEVLSNDVTAVEVKLVDLVLFERTTYFVEVVRFIALGNSEGTGLMVCIS